MTEVAARRRGDGLPFLRDLSPARRKEALQGLAFISPWLIGFLAFTAYPMVASLYYSFTKYQVLAAPRWVGLQNYVYAFTGKPFGTTGDPLFWLAMERTVVWVIATVPLGIFGSLLAAILLNRGLRWTSAYRTAFFLPSLTPIVAAALLWQWILQPDVGVINSLLETLFGIRGPRWLADVDWALPSLAMISLWTAIGGNRMLIFLAGLQGIPQELYEAARVDGAGPVRTWRHITVPLITPALFFNLVLGVIVSFRVFAFAFVTTGGGPARSTYFYALHLYTMAFSSFDMGYGSTLAWILFLIVLGITLLNMKLAKRWVYYESLR
ncbi:MAG TPA: sugar ABC transporter permease [Chloroflexota bacterium]|jgi:multiple sugar transport system permease protein|nr:sugar ABC transporter permease [Chloroflexota bacterium]